MIVYSDINKNNMRLNSTFANICDGGLQITVARRSILYENQTNTN